MKYIGIGLIWLGYAGAVAAAAFGASTIPNAVLAVGFFGAFGATVSTIFVAVTG